MQQIGIELKEPSPSYLKYLFKFLKLFEIFISKESSYFSHNCIGLLLANFTAEKCSVRKKY